MKEKWGGEGGGCFKGNFTLPDPTHTGRVGGVGGLSIAPGPEDSPRPGVDKAGGTRSWAGSTSGPGRHAGSWGPGLLCQARTGPPLGLGPSGPRGSGPRPPTPRPTPPRRRLSPGGGAPARLVQGPGTS